MSKSDYIPKGDFEHLLAALTPENRLACELSLATGLRIGDVLSLKSSDLKQRITIKEEKTGKSRRVYIPAALLERLVAHSGRYYVFEGRCSPRKHRTRQAVWKDLKRVARVFRCARELSISPHTARKVYAVGQYQKSDLEHVQALLNHSSEAVTILYAMADILTQRHSGKKGK